MSLFAWTAGVPIKIFKARFFSSFWGASTTTKTGGGWEFSEGRKPEQNPIFYKFGMLSILIICILSQRIQTLIEDQQSQTPEPID